jgi:hypothetical protein
MYRESPSHDERGAEGRWPLARAGTGVGLLVGELKVDHFCRRLSLCRSDATFLIDSTDAWNVAPA